MLQNWFMDRLPNIAKAALIAKLNDSRQCPIVDTFYRTEPNGETKLILVFADGRTKIFEGLQAA